MHQIFSASNHGDPLANAHASEAALASIRVQKIEFLMTSLSGSPAHWSCAAKRSATLMVWEILWPLPVLGWAELNFKSYHMRFESVDWEAMWLKKQLCSTQVIWV